MSNTAVKTSCICKGIVVEVYRTKDGQVSKYVHDDGSETAIKTISSCDNSFGEASQVVREKYSVFISVSVSCFIRCNFCYLTVKDYPFYTLTATEILDNIKKALETEVKHNPELKKKYIKVAWMGMGDALVSSDTVNQVTVSFLDWVFDNGYAKGLDGVDLSTAFPPITNAKMELISNDFSDMRSKLRRYPFNPVHPKERTAFRLFYSLHSVNQKTRQMLIPKAMEVGEALNLMNDFSRVIGTNLIYHHLFFKGINDSAKEVNDLIEFLNRGDQENNELRILRFNKCDGTIYEESPLVDIIIERLSREVPRLKYQISTGSEIKAACGQFILRQLAT